MNTHTISKIVGDLKSRIVQRLFRGDYAELNESIGASRKPLSKQGRGVKTVDLAGDLAWKFRRVEEIYSGYSGLSCHQTSPHRINADAQRREGAHPGYGYIGCQRRLSSPVISQRNGPDCGPARKCAEFNCIQLYQRGGFPSPSFIVARPHILPI
jgi:hypothetical protein